jgi:hypothetical protein
MSEEGYDYNDPDYQDSGMFDSEHDAWHTWSCNRCGVNDAIDYDTDKAGVCTSCADDINGTTKAGDQSDNQAAARAVSNTLATPGDRANDVRRRPQLDHSRADRQEMQRENVYEM